MPHIDFFDIGHIFVAEVSGNTALVHGRTYRVSNVNGLWVAGEFYGKFVRAYRGYQVHYRTGLVCQATARTPYQNDIICQSAEVVDGDRDALVAEVCNRIDRLLGPQPVRIGGTNVRRIVHDVYGLHGWVWFQGRMVPVRQCLRSNAWTSTNPRQS